MPGRTKKVEVAGVQVTARELSIEEIYHWLGAAEARFDAAINAEKKPDAVGAMLLDTLTLDDLMLTSDLTEVTWRKAYPSEMDTLIDAVKEVNPHFFALRERMGEILETLLSRSTSPAQPSQEQ